MDPNTNGTNIAIYCTYFLYYRHLQFKTSGLGISGHNIPSETCDLIIPVDHKQTHYWHYLCFRFSIQSARSVAQLMINHNLYFGLQLAKFIILNSVTNYYIKSIQIGLFYF